MSNLPLDGAREILSGFVLAVRGDEIVACAAMERYGAVGLLRSVAVKEAERNTGLGKEVVKRALSAAKESGMGEIVLLTETARGFFPKFGFREITRAEVPEPALESVEFKSACPQSAAVMRMKL